jgi:hypothetical protein
LYVAERSRWPLDLEEHQVGQRRLGALDPAGHHRFPANERAGE